MKKGSTVQCLANRTSPKGRPTCSVTVAEARLGAGAIHSCPDYSLPIQSQESYCPAEPSTRSAASRCPSAVLVGFTLPLFLLIVPQRMARAQTTSTEYNATRIDFSVSGAVGGFVIKPNRPGGENRRPWVWY